MTPVYRNVGSNAERRFNQKHKASRHVVECAYGSLRERFPCLNHLRVKPTYAGQIIMACATLHNVCSKSDFAFNPPLIDTDDAQPTARAATNSVGNRRYNEILSHFI